MAAKNPVPRSELERIAREEGCALEQMASCIKVSKGKSPNRLYITNPTQCARVDISNFDHPDEGIVRRLGGESFGKVHQMLRFDRPVPDILAAFRTLCRGLDTWPSHPKRERQSPVGLPGSRPRRGGPLAIEVVPAETPAQHAERLVARWRTIKRYSDQTGIPISKRTVAELSARAKELGVELEA